MSKKQRQAYVSVVYRSTALPLRHAAHAVPLYLPRCTHPMQMAICIRRIRARRSRGGVEGLKACCLARPLAKRWTSCRDVWAIEACSEQCVALQRTTLLSWHTHSIFCAPVLLALLCFSEHISNLIYRGILRIRMAMRGRESVLSSRDWP